MAPTSVSAARAKSSSPGAQRYRHVEMFWLSLTILLLAFLMEVGTEGRVHFYGLSQWPLPESCMSRQLFGISCPGCGLTRSYIYLAHGEWTKAFEIHRIGWLLFLMTALQIPYRLLCLRWTEKRFLSLRVSQAIGTTLIFLLIGNWVVRLIFP